MHDRMETNSAPVDYDDFQATILEIIGQKDNSFGTSFFDWKKGDVRRRVVYARGNDDTAPKVSGSPWNRYYGFVYYRNAEELADRVRSNVPDIIEVANKWRTAPF